MKIARLLVSGLACALMTACPAEKTETTASTETHTETSTTESAEHAGSGDAARQMYAQIMGRYAPVGTCETSEFYWEFTPTTVRHGETLCQIHGLDTLMDQLSIDARQCMSEGEDSGTRLYYIAAPAPNLIQLTGSDLQQELERCGMV